MSLVAVGLVVLAFPGVVFGGRTFSSAWGVPNVNGVNPPPAGIHVAESDPRLDRGASAWQFEPWAEATNRALRQGEAPLWNPSQGMGAPLSANFQSATFDPLHIPVNLHPTPLTWDLSTLLAFAFGAASMYLFLRQRQLGRTASLVGTAPFILSGYFFLYSNNSFMRSYLYLPLLFLLTDRVARTTSRTAPILLGAAVAGNLLVGMPEASICVLGSMAAYAVYLVVMRDGPHSRRSLLLRFSGAALVGGALPSPLLLPGFEYLSVAATTHAPGADVGLAADPPRLLLNFFTPTLLQHSARNWVGVATLCLVVGALAARRRETRWDSWFFFVLGAGILAKAYGLPLIQWTGHLPVINQTNIPAFALPVVGFCAAVLAGTGYQAVVDCQIARRKFAVLGGLTGAMLLSLLWVNRRALDSLSAGQVLKTLLLAAGVAGIVVYTSLRNRPHRQALVALAIVGELLVLAPRDFGSSRVDPYPRTRWIDYVVDHAAVSRERVYAMETKLFPNTAAPYGLLDIRALDALYPKRFVNYIRHFVQPDFVDRFVGGPYGHGHEQSPALIEGNPMFDLTGVRYVVTGGAIPGDPSQAVFRDNRVTQLLHPAVFDINGDRRPVALIHSGARATLSVPSGTRRMTFSFALAQEAFADRASDGVDVRVVPSGGDGSNVLWSTSIVPRVDPPSAVWRDATIDLPSGLRAIDLAVSERSNGRTDWFGITGLRFDTPGVLPLDQYRLVVSSDGAFVYENRSRLPRAFVVHDVKAVRNESAAYQFLESVSLRLPSGSFLVQRFDPARQAVVENLAPKDQAAIRDCQQAGSGLIRTYKPLEVVVEATSDCAGLLILTDTYFPGWKATVNGRPATIHATNGMFRGVLVEPGRSTVVFRYRPHTFAAGLRISGAAVVGSLGFLMLPTLRQSTRRLRRR